MRADVEDGAEREDGEDAEDDPSEDEEDSPEEVRFESEDAAAAAALDAAERDPASSASASASASASSFAAAAAFFVVADAWKAREESSARSIQRWNVSLCGSSFCEKTASAWSTGSGRTSTTLVSSPPIASHMRSGAHPW